MTAMHVPHVHGNGTPLPILNITLSIADVKKRSWEQSNNGIHVDFK